MKPYSCHLCPHKSKIAGNLDKHLRSVHNLHIPDKRKYSHLYNLGRNLSHLDDMSQGTDKDGERDRDLQVGGQVEQGRGQDQQYSSEAGSILQGESNVTEHETANSVDLTCKPLPGGQGVGGPVEKDKDTMFTNMANANPAYLLEAYQTAMARASQVSVPPHGMPVFPMPQPYRSADPVSSMPYVLSDQAYTGQPADSYSMQDSLNYSMDSYR